MIPQTSAKALEVSARSIADELEIMDPSCDAGVVPLYSLLGELAELLQPDAAAHAEVSKCLEQLGQVLDGGGLPPAAVIEALRNFYKRLDYFVRYYDTGEAIEWAKLQEFWGEGETASTEGGSEAAPATKPESESASAAPPETPAAADVPEDQLMVVDLAGMRDVLEEFYQEAEEHLGQIEAALLEMESDYRATEPIRAMFRSFHTIKGVAGFLDLVPVRSLAHEIETLLDLIRSDKLHFTESTVSLVLESRDRLHLLVEQVAVALSENSQPSEIVPVRDLILKAQAAIAQNESAQNTAPADGEAPAAGRAAVDPAAEKADGPGGAGLDPVAASDAPAAEPEKIAPASAAGEEAAADPAAGAPKAAAKKVNSTIRMNTDKLDSIIEAVGELVIVESQLADSIAAISESRNPRVENNLRQLNRITRELQMSSMSLRMVSLKPLFQRMQRLARDVANKSGKKVNFRVEGEDTEMDRTVVEQIGDALVHMIRNSVDHGIELPAERLAKGKPEVGEVLLRASYIGQNIVLDLEDDGAGVISEKVLSKAKKRGLVIEGKDYTREEILQMIFLPGFSTVDQVSDFSGRGVGMDVVRSNVQQLRGRVDLSSTEGQGSKLSIALPLTMAIIDGLLVRCGGQRYVVPVSSISMTLKPDPSQVFEVQSRGQVIKHRDQIHKLLYMSDLFGIESEVTRAADGIVVMMETAICDYGLVVDEILHKQEVVIKQLGTTLSDPEGVSGGAILGDGTVALILDPAAMAEMAALERSGIPAELTTA
ncbi:MAG: chemotaxis protein CheA [Opitutales bacterium]